MRGRVAIVALGLFGLLAGCADREPPRMADGRLAVFPGSLDFSLVALHDGRDLKVALRNVGRGELGIDRAWVEEEVGNYDAHFVDPSQRVVISGGEADMQVHFGPMLAGMQKATLVVETDSHDHRRFELPLLGTGVDNAAVPAQQSLDFGRIEVGTEKALDLALNEPSPLGTTVKVQVVGDNADEFTSTEVTLGPGETRPITVTFKPTKVGVKSASLAITPCTGCAVETVTLIAEGLDRAIIAEPNPLDFGQVPIDKVAKGKITLRNISTEPATASGMSLASSTDPSFTAPPPALPATIAPGQEVTVELDYSPGHMGPASGTAVFQIESKRHPTLEVGLTAFGGATQICVGPVSYDYGTQPVGSKTWAKINVKNCGSGDAPALTLDGLKGVWGDLDQFSLGNTKFPVTLAAGQETNLYIFYEPTRAGGATATFELDDSVYPGKVDIQVGGEAELHLPCKLEITPKDGLDFGTIPPGNGAVLGIKVKNVGDDLCPVKNIQLADDGNGAYGMPGGVLPGIIIYPGDYFSFQVSFFAPSTPGEVDGKLQIQQQDPANPTILVPLVGNSQTSCLVANPWFVDFGIERPDCPPGPRQVNFLNGCASPVTIRGIKIGAGTTDGEFTLAPTDPMPLTLAAGESTTVTVSYLAQVPGMNLAPLYVDADGLDRPLLVPLLGESNDHEEQTDTFVQQDGSKVDVLFVVDNTRSMVEEQPRLQAALPTFVDAAKAKAVDLHVAVTTTGIEPDPDSTCPGGAQGGEAGRFFPADNSKPRILTNATPNLATQLQANADVGVCYGKDEDGFEAMRRALSSPLVDHADDARTALPNDGDLGFLRREAAIAVVFVSDEDDSSKDDVETYVRFLQSVKGIGQPQRATIFAIAPDGTACSTAGGNGDRYATAAKMTGGEVLSICASNYAPLLADVADKTFSPQTVFPLSATPDGAGDITVTVNGTVQNGGWGYDAGNNAVVFDTPPPPGATITISYKKVCGA